MLLMRDRRSIYLNCAFFFVLIVGYFLIFFRGDSGGDVGPLVSFESAGLESPLQPLGEGVPRSIKDYRGAPILLHFWASWCEPCSHDEKPLHDLFAATGGRGTRFVEIASEDRVEAVQRAGKMKAYPGDNFLDKQGDLAKAFALKTYPSTVLIDRDGRMLFKGEGPLTVGDVTRLKEVLTASASGVLPEFEFASASGGKLSSGELLNKVWVADFIFTSCGDTCPLISEKLRAVQEEFAGNPDFRIVSFSVDPQNDLPEKLREFAHVHGANSAVWTFLRPPAANLRELMVQGFKLGTVQNPLIHTAKIVVVNRGNVVTEYFDGGDTDAVPKLKEKIRQLLAQK
jgi:protein SCO1/2